jgi:hypothetical protein
MLAPAPPPIDPRPVSYWGAIEDEFIKGIPIGDGSARWPTASELGRRYKISVQTIRTRIYAEGWRKKRELYIEALVARRDQARGDMVRDGVDFDRLALRTAKNAMILIGKRVQEIGQAAYEREQLMAEQRQEALDNGWPMPEPIKSVIDAKELQALGRAHHAWYDVGSTAKGSQSKAPIETPGVPSSLRGLERFDEEQLSTLYMLTEKLLEHANGTETSRQFGLPNLDPAVLAPPELADISGLVPADEPEPGPS